MWTLDSKTGQRRKMNSDEVAHFEAVARGELSTEAVEAYPTEAPVALAPEHRRIIEADIQNMDERVRERAARGQTANMCETIEEVMAIQDMEFNPLGEQLWRWFMGKVKVWDVRASKFFVRVFPSLAKRSEGSRTRAMDFRGASVPTMSGSDWDQGIYENEKNEEDWRKEAELRE